MNFCEKKNIEAENFLCDFCSENKELVLKIKKSRQEIDKLAAEFKENDKSEKK